MISPRSLGLRNSQSTSKGGLDTACSPLYPARSITSCSRLIACKNSLEGLEPGLFHLVPDPAECLVLDTYFSTCAGLLQALHVTCAVSHAQGLTTSKLKSLCVGWTGFNILLVYGWIEAFPGLCTQETIWKIITIFFTSMIKLHVFGCIIFSI